MKYYHGSKSSGVTTLNQVVGEFDNDGGIFITPDIDFAKGWGKYVYEVELLTDNIFDFENKEHKKLYATYILNGFCKQNNLELSYEEVYGLLFGDFKTSYLYSKIEPEKYKKEYDYFFKAKLKGKVRTKDEFGDPLDYYEDPDKYAVDILNEYPTKKIDNINYLMRKLVLYKDYLSIEKNDRNIKNIGFDAAYVWEARTRNVHVYNSDNVRIIRQLNENIKLIYNAMKYMKDFLKFNEDLAVNNTGKMEGPYDDVEIEVKKDFGGYFENLVKQAVAKKKEKGEKFAWKKIIITSGPYRAYDMHAKRTNEEGVMNIDFYSAVRNGFGSGQATVENILTML